MKVAVYQTNPKLLDVEHNLKTIISKIKEGKDKGAELIAFPELALTGYFVANKYHKVALRLDSPQIKQLVKATKGTAAIVGFIEESESMDFYNSALVAVDGKIETVYRKINLPNYGNFEERKFFSGGNHVPVFRLNGFTIAVFICNDLWHPSIPYLAVCQKADIFITIFNSSEGSMTDEFSNIESWAIINKFYSRIFGIYNICANRVGNEKYVNDDGESQTYHFWGISSIVNPFGKDDAVAKSYEEDTIFAEISRSLLRKKKILLPYLRNDDPHFTMRELKRIL